MSSRFPESGLSLLLLSLTVLCGGARPHPADLLRVCADPDNLPFSNQRGQGFENRIAQLLAHDLHLTLEYSWRAQRRGFVRKTLDTGLCDAVIGVPLGLDALLRTAPYYRSTYVFVSRRRGGIAPRTLDDGVLRRVRVGVQVIGDDGADTPPAFVLAKRGIIGNVRSYPVPDDAAPNGSAPRIISAVAHGEVDVALAWGPLAGYWVRKSGVPLTLTPVAAPPDLSFIPFVFDIAIGVRRTDPGLRARLDSALIRNRVEIGRILDGYGIPRIAPPRPGL